MERQEYRPRLVKILKDNGIPERLLAASSFWKNKFYVTINDRLDPDTKQCLIWDLEKEFPGYIIELHHF